MTTYTIEKLTTIIGELKELSKLHYDEVAPYDDIPLNVNWEKLAILESCGVLKVYTMREDDVLIGYALFFVGFSIEYSDSLQATLSNIFIHPGYRGIGTRFIRWCDNQLKMLGVQVVSHHVKAKNDYGVLLKRLGYAIMNIEYSKRLDK